MLRWTPNHLKHPRCRLFERQGTPLCLAKLFIAQTYRNETNKNVASRFGRFTSPTDPNSHRSSQLQPCANASPSTLARFVPLSFLGGAACPALGHHDITFLFFILATQRKTKISATNQTHGNPTASAHACSARLLLAWFSICAKEPRFRMILLSPAAPGSFC
jgi:hypothetical protein